VYRAKLDIRHAGTQDNTMDRLIVFDTTLRDGEQSPGASLTSAEKIKIARQLARLNVDVIEAGFPAASGDDAAAVRIIGERIRGPIICALARCRKEDIEAALRALEKCPRPRVHLFLATSEIHRRYKLGKAKSEIVRIARESVRMARRHMTDVEFSPEDASRTEPDFLMEVCEAVVAEGVSTINIPDTVGYAVPFQFGPLIAHLRTHLPEQVMVSVHCHDDLGLAVANSLEAVRCGARQVECTINGIGERAGNASLEEIVMNLVVRKDAYGLETGVQTREIYQTSKLVASMTGIPVQPNKAIVGENAFRHEAGIHQDGVLKRRETYEIMRPAMVGIHGSKLVLGKHSGRHALKMRLAKLGVSLSDAELQSVFERFKALADKKKEITDLDLLVIAEEETAVNEAVYALDYFHVISGTSTVPSATVRVRRGAELLEDASSGDGPVDAFYRAVNRITGLSPVLKEYKITAVTGGIDAQGEVRIILSIEDVSTAGRAASTDIIEASGRAYLQAINRYLAKKALRPALHTQGPHV